MRDLEYNEIIENRGITIEYMSAKEAADKWGISQRRVAVLCSESRVSNAAMVAFANVL